MQRRLVHGLPRGSSRRRRKEGKQGEFHAVELASNVENVTPKSGEEDGMDISPHAMSADGWREFGWCGATKRPSEIADGLSSYRRWGAFLNLVQVTRGGNEIALSHSNRFVSNGMSPG
jgi:hypothetical protein